MEGGGTLSRSASSWLPVTLTMSARTLRDRVGEHSNARASPIRMHPACVSSMQVQPDNHLPAQFGQLDGLSGVAVELRGPDSFSFLDHLQFVLSLRCDTMLTGHEILAYLVVGVPALAALVGGLVYWRRRGAGSLLADLLALAQDLLVAQVGLRLPPACPMTAAPATSSTTSTARSRSAPFFAPWMRAPLLGAGAGCSRSPARLFPRGGARRASIHDGTVVEAILLQHAAIRRIPDHRADRTTS